MLLNEGLNLCDGRELKYDTKSKTDCLLFWYKIEVTELIFNVLNVNNFPLCMRDSTIINDAKPSDKIVVDQLDVTIDYDGFMEEARKEEEEWKKKIMMEEERTK